MAVTEVEGMRMDRIFMGFNWTITILIVGFLILSILFLYHNDNFKVGNPPTDQGKYNIIFYVILALSVIMLALGILAIVASHKSYKEDDYKWSKIKHALSIVSLIYFTLILVGYTISFAIPRSSLGSTAEILYWVMIGIMGLGIILSLILVIIQDRFETKAVS